MANANALNLPIPVTVSYGGTGITSGTPSGVPYFSNSSTIASSSALTTSQLIIGSASGPATLAAGATGQPLTIVGGVPTYAALNLAGGSSVVTGLLPVVDGGTGIGSGTSGGVPYFSSSTTIASSLVLTASQLVIGGGAGVAPSTLAAGSTGQPLVINGSGNPQFGALNLAGTSTVSGLLPVGFGGTGIGSGTSGGVPYFSSSTTIASSLVLTTSQLVIGGGAGVAPSTLAAGTNGQVLGLSSGIPTWVNVPTFTAYSTITANVATAVPGTLYFVNNTSSTTTITVTLPAAPTTGTIIGVTGLSTSTFTGNSSTASWKIIPGGTTDKIQVGAMVSSVGPSGYVESTLALTVPTLLNSPVTDSVYLLYLGTPTNLWIAYEIVGLLLPTN